MDTDIRSILDRLIANARIGYADASRLIGRNPAYIQQFIKRGTPRKLDEEDRQILARYFGVSEETLGGPSSRSGSPNPARTASSITAIPRLTLGASAGSGSLDEEDHAQGFVNFDSGWLRTLGVTAQNASVIRVCGESMLPTLHDGDEIMVDHDDNSARLRDGVYVLRLDGLLMVKRIVLGPRRGHFSVISDNPYYPDWTDINLALVEILGRVAWNCRQIR